MAEKIGRIEHTAESAPERPLFLIHKNTGKHVVTIRDGQTLEHEISGERLIRPRHAFVVQGGLHTGSEEPPNAIAHVRWDPDKRVLLIRPIKGAILTVDEKDRRLKK